MNVARVQISPSPPYKNANIDTVSVNISVLILCMKSLYLRDFQDFYRYLSQALLRQTPVDSLKSACFDLPSLTICPLPCSLFKVCSF